MNLSYYVSRTKERIQHYMGRIFSPSPRINLQNEEKSYIKSQISNYLSRLFDFAFDSRGLTLTRNKLRLEDLVSS